MPAAADAPLADLLAEREGLCASFHLPLTPSDADGRQVRIRWKNLLHRAESEARAMGASDADVKSLLARARAFDPRSVLARRRAEGVAVFAAEEFLRAEPIDGDPGEGVVVAKRFHLMPLLHAWARRGRFHVLALSQRHVRLIEATPRTAAEVDVPRLPRSIEEALAYDEHEEVAQMHGTGPQGTPQAGGVHHGQGGKPEVHKNEQLRFCRHVAAAVEPMLRAERAPLVLACVDELRPIYEEASSYTPLVSEHVAGNPDRLRADELADRAREILDERFSRSERGAIAKFHALAGTGETSASLEEVVEAALDGRIETLFLLAEASDGGPRDDDLDVAAVAALRSGATIHVLSRDRFPARDTPAAAILRY